MRILITGSSGLVGTALIAQLQKEHDIVRLIRSKVTNPIREVFWDPANGVLDAGDLDGINAVVHLAGENIAGGRWNNEKKRRIRESRVQGTTLLCETLAGMEQPPDTLISASAIGYYGERGDEQLTENSEPGSGFLPEVCQKWEATTQPARDQGIRVVNLRIGIVLATKGGALKEMLTPFKLGVGGVMGSGKQFWSWIALDDLVGIIQFALANESLSGPVNAVVPTPVTNAEFTRALGKVLHRPTFFPLPAFMAKTVLGEMAEALILASARVLPEKLQQNGYPYQHPELLPALQHILKSTS